MENYTITAKTFAGLEPVLVKEIEGIGGKNILPGRRAVTFNGSLKHIYRANYYFRTAIRVLREINRFTFTNVDDFYKKCRSIQWGEIMNETHDFAVFSIVSNSKDFRNSMFASLKVKDAIVDTFRIKTGVRPNVNTIDPDIILNVHIAQNRCIISVDSSGESLHKRGYRIASGNAPLSEVLAAGMVMLSGWDGTSDFIDPMCGSGTLPIEAALIATNTPPGKFRKEFAFEKWDDFNMDLFTSVAEEAKPTQFKKTIYASDISQKNMGYAKANARNARVFNTIKFETTDFKKLELKTNGATLMINPPYGERLIEKNLVGLYETIGERFKHKFPGNEAWVLSSSIGLMKHIGLKPAKKQELFNGALPCTFRKYELFQGKRTN